MVRETRHLWVGNLPETIRNEKIVEHFTRYGRVESVKILPRRSVEGGRAAFVDFVDIRSATKAHESVNRIGDRELRTDYNEPSGNTTSITRMHGDLRNDPRIEQNSPGDVRTRLPQAGSPPRRRYDRRAEGMPDGRYGNRQQGSYDNGYSDEEGGPPRQTAVGGRLRYADRSSHGRSYHHRGDQMRRHNMGKPGFHERGPSPEHSSDSESDSESQSVSKSGSGTSSEGTSSNDDSEADSRSVTPAAEAASGRPGRASALCIRNLSMRSSGSNERHNSSDFQNYSSIRDGLFHEFKKYGEVNRIYIHGQGNSRYAIIYFKRADEAERGMEACHGKVFLGTEMNISLWNESPPKQYKQYDNNYYDRYEGDYSPRNNRGSMAPVDDEYDPAATRTLFVGNIEKTTTYGDLKEAFERYGEIVDIDIKKQAGNNPYAFLQFADLHCAIQARRQMDREYVGRNRVKVGFGKVSPINTIWVGGVTASLSEQQLERHFGRYGRVTRVVINRLRGQALISFDSVESAGMSQSDMKGRLLFGRRVRVEFVSRDSRQLFFDDMQRLGQDDRRRHYDTAPHDTRPRGRGGFYDRRGGYRGGRGMRGDMRWQGFRQWHGPDYEYRDGGNYHRQGGHPRHRGPYEGYESDDYDKELREYENISRQKERERERYRERQRGRHNREPHPRDKEEGDYSGSERYYPDERDRWQDHDSSSGSYVEEETHESKGSRSREPTDERHHNRTQQRDSEDDSDQEVDQVRVLDKEREQEPSRDQEREVKPENNCSEDEDKVSIKSDRQLEQLEKKRRKKEKKVKKLQKSAESEKIVTNELVEEEKAPRTRKKRSLSKEGVKVHEDNEVAVSVPKGPRTPEPEECEPEEKEPLPSPPVEKIAKSKKLASKKKKKHKRIRTPPEPEEEDTPTIDEVPRKQDKFEEKQPENYENIDSITEGETDNSHPEYKEKENIADVSRSSEEKEEKGFTEGDGKEFERVKPRRRSTYEEPCVDEHENNVDSSNRESVRSLRKSYREEKVYRDAREDSLYREEKPPREEKPYRDEKPNRDEKLYRDEKLHRDEKPYRESKPYRDEKAYRDDKTYREEKPHRHDKAYRGDKPFGDEKAHREDKPYKDTRPYRDEKPYREEKMYKEDKSYSKERRREWEEKERPKRPRLTREESPPPPPPPPPPPVDIAPPSDSRTPEARPLPPLGQEIGQYDNGRGPLGVYSPATHSPMHAVGKVQVGSLGAGLGTPTPPMMSPSTAMTTPPSHALPLPPPQQYASPAPPAPPQHNNADTLLDLLRRYPVMWQGIVALKNDQAAVQMHYLAGNAHLAELSLPQLPVQGMGGVPPPLRISQRMRLEPSQLEGVIRRMQVDNEHCLLLALPCGRDPLDVHAQTRALRNGFINYLQQKQAAGIINVAGQGSTQPSYVLHIFPPCEFAQEHLARVSPDLLDSAADSGHLMVVVASV